MSNFFINRYLQHSLRREISELYISVAIKDFAFSMIAIFEPIYLYQQYNSISFVFLYFAVVYTIYFFAIPLGSKAAAKYGFEHCILYSIPFAIIYFLILSQIPENKFLIVFAVLSLVLYKILFWPAYHADFAHYSKTGYRGREIGVLSLISTISNIAGPLIGGILLSRFGFEVLLVVVSIISLISAIPLFTTREKFEPHKFSFIDSLKRIFKPYDHYKRKDFIVYFGYGEELIAAVAWPIFVYLLIKEFYLMGIIISIVTVILAIISLYAGRLADILDKEGKKKMYNFSTILQIVSCFMRPFAGNWLGVIFVDALSSGSKVGINYTLVTSAYNKGDNHKGFLKYVSFFEMSLALGKMSIAWIIFIISLFFSEYNLLVAVFWLAGLWSLFYAFKFYDDSKWKLFNQ